jgi:hypothetical protein
MRILYLKYNSNNLNFNRIFLYYFITYPKKPPSFLKKSPMFHKIYKEWMTSQDILWIGYFACKYEIHIVFITSFNLLRLLLSTHTHTHTSNQTLECIENSLDAQSNVKQCLAFEQECHVNCLLTCPVTWTSLRLQGPWSSELYSQHILIYRVSTADPHWPKPCGVSM